MDLREAGREEDFGWCPSLFIFPTLLLEGEFGGVATHHLLAMEQPLYLATVIVIASSPLFHVLIQQVPPQLICLSLLIT